MVTLLAAATVVAAFATLLAGVVMSNITWTWPMILVIVGLGIASGVVTSTVMVDAQSKSDAWVIALLIAALTVGWMFPLVFDAGDYAIMCWTMGGIISAYMWISGLRFY